MKRFAFFSILAGIIFYPMFLSAGIEWQAQIMTKGKDKESKMIIHGYAQTFTISNPKVDVQELEKEKILGFDCRHIKINTSYDMETKIMIMKMKTHNEESKELWITPTHIEDISLNFFKKLFSSGIAELDSMIRKETGHMQKVKYYQKAQAKCRYRD